MPKNLVQLFLLCVLISFIFPCPIQAATPRGSIEAYPVFADVVLENPQQNKEIIFSYKNNSTGVINLELFPIDFRQADRTGALSFTGAESGSFSYSLSSFLSFESNTLQLDPGEKKDFRVTITNRDDLSPGGHYAAVVARLVTEETSTSQAQIAPSISSLILLRKVGGERFNLSLSELDFPKGVVSFSYPSTVAALFRNEGNVHLVPFGTIEVRDMFGRTIYKGIINTSSLRVFPETRRLIAIDMQKTAWSLPVSFNTIEVRGDDSLKKVDYTYKASFIYLSPMFIGGIAVAAVAAILLQKKLMSKRGKNKK
jgi:hypothetical protein